MSRFVARFAKQDDSSPLCEFLKSSAMHADVKLSFDRSPDFFAIYKAQTDKWKCWLSEKVDVANGASNSVKTTEITGTVSLLVRDGYVNGEECHVGYLGDLRIINDTKALLQFAKGYKPNLHECETQWGARLFLTTILDNNSAAREMLVEKKHNAFPRYWKLNSFAIRSIYTFMQLPQVKPRNPTNEFSIEQTTIENLAEVAAFLDKENKKRMFGYPYSPDILREQQSQRAGFSLSDLFFARDKNGLIVATMGVWDMRAIKRIYVHSYSKAMRVQVAAHNAFAKLVGSVEMPSSGHLDVAYITHYANARKDDKATNALLRQCVRVAKNKRCSALLFSVFDGEHGKSAFAGLLYADVRSTLYAVGTQDEKVNEVVGHPGFEMAFV